MTVKESCMVEIYTKDTESFSVGKVFCQNNDSVVFEDIDTQGKITGYYVMRKKIISRLDYDTEYLNKLSKYMEFAEKHSYSDWFSLKHITLNPEESLIWQVLEYAKDNNLVITIDMDNAEELETGYVKNIETDKIAFTCLNILNAQSIEDITVAIEDINLIEFEGIDNLLLQYANTAIEAK